MLHLANTTTRLRFNLETAGAAGSCSAVFRPWMVHMDQEHRGPSPAALRVWYMADIKCLQSGTRAVFHLYVWKQGLITAVIYKLQRTKMTWLTNCLFVFWRIVAKWFLPLIRFLMCMCVFVCVCASPWMLSEHSCDVDSAAEGELCLPLLSPADAPPHLHPTVNWTPDSVVHSQQSRSS